MPPTSSASATQAAVSAATRLGLRCTEPSVLADGANTVIRLSPSPVVAKVAASTSSLRTHPAAWLRRELAVAAFLAEAGMPVLAPSPEVPAVVHDEGGHVMSFWTYVAPAGSGPPDETVVGSMLRDLHAALRRYPDELPMLAPLGDIPAFLARPRRLLRAGEVAMLSEAYRRHSAGLDATRAAAQVLHGDAGVLNLMATGHGWAWHDFEDTCAGPPAWDLAATTANPRLDSARILAAYGDTVDPGVLRSCEQLRRLSLTVWYCLYAERMPELRRRAAGLVASWRT